MSEFSAPQIYVLIFKQRLPSANLIYCRLSLFPFGFITPVERTVDLI